MSGAEARAGFQHRCQCSPFFPWVSNSYSSPGSVRGTRQVHSAAFCLYTRRTRPESDKLSAVFRAGTAADAGNALAHGPCEAPVGRALRARRFPGCACHTHGALGELALPCRNDGQETEPWLKSGGTSPRRMARPPSAASPFGQGVRRAAPQEFCLRPFRRPLSAAAKWSAAALHGLPFVLFSAIMAA